MEFLRNPKETTKPDLMPVIPNSISPDDEMSHPTSHSVSGTQSNESPSHQGKGDKNMYSSISGGNSNTNDVQLKYEVEQLKLALAQSSANEKKLEIELATLKNNIAQQTRDPQERTVIADESKKQLDTYKEENMQIKADLENNQESLVHTANLQLRKVDVQPKIKENEHPMDTNDEDQQIEFDKRPGTSGASKGHKYEIKLVMFFLLQGKINVDIENFYLASNMDGAGDFDDVVFKYTYDENGVKKTSIIFLQAKHKESTKCFNLDSMFPRRKGDFDLRKYLRSYEVIKQQFETNRNHPIFENEFDNSNYFIFTNTSFDFNNCKEDVEECEMEQENFLNLKKDAHDYKIKDSDKIMRALRKSPDSNMHDEDAAIREFLNKLRIFDSQFNETELEEEINRIIASNYSVDKSEAALIFFEVYHEVEKWWQNEKLYLTKNNKFFESAKEKVSKRSLTVVASMGRAQMNALKIQFQEDHVKNMKKLIDENQILNIVTKTATFTTAKVYQALEDTTKYKSKEAEENDYKYLFISSELTTNIQNKIINSFESTQFNLLVLGCERNKYNFKNLYDKLSHIIKGDGNKKIIMIGHDNNKSTIFDSMDCKYKIYEDTEIISDLTDKSQEELLNNVKAIFQGKEVILGKLLNDNKIRKLIDRKMLSEVVNTSRINLGESLNNLGEIEKYYVNRIFNHQVKIKVDFEDQSIFFVTKNSQITEKNIKSIEDIILISDVEDDFFTICTNENYKTKNIHRLKEEDGVFTWVQSRGSLSNLRNFIDAEIINPLKEEDMISVNDKVVIISAEPGMGKSTVLTTLAELIKRSDPSLWVQTINLNDHTDHLQKMDLKKDRKDETIKLLLNIVKTKSGLETELFKRRIYEEGKLVLLFDGFDEVSPTYDDKVIELLNVLRNTKTEKLWITTRPHLRRKLEDKLGVIAYTLRSLTRNDQITFLRNFWNERLDLNIEFDNRADSFICELLDVLKKSISDEELQFTGLPLQTRMLAEIFQEKFNVFYVFKEQESNIPERLDLVDLYKTFIDKKCIIFYEEKNGVTLSKPAIKKQYKNEFLPKFLRNHKILGIDLIFFEQNEFLSMDEQNVLKKFKNDFNEEDDKTGIVIQIVNDKPIFVHRTFGEYFAALWFADKVEENNEQIKNKLLKYIFKNGYEFLKIVFDRLLTKDKCKIHNIVLNNDESIDKLLLDDVDDVNLLDKGGRTAIHLAAAYGYEKFLKILLENSKKEASLFNDKINTKDSVFNWSALKYAVKGEHWNIVELLLQNGAISDDMFKNNSGIKERINSATEGTSVIHLSAEKGYVKLIEVLLQNGPKSNVKNVLRIAAKYEKFVLNDKGSYDIDNESKLFQTPLYTAVKNEQIEVVKLLVDNGANINANNANGPSWREKNWSILHVAAYVGNKEIVEILINKGADTNAVDKEGKTPLYIAIKNEKVEIVKLLVNNDANININNAYGPSLGDRNWSILHIAAFTGNKEIVEFLINTGADINTKNGNGFTPLYIAVENEKIEVVKLLVENGANVYAKCVSWIFEKLLNLQDVVDVGNKEIVEFLINNGTDPNVEFKDGKTPLLVAVQNDKIEVVKLLVDNGANINHAKVNDNWSILHIAAKKGNKEIVKFLINKGADINAKNINGETPLYLAVQNEKLEAVKLLVDNGANVNANHTKGYSLYNENWSILHVAASVGNKDIVEFLINKGADTNAENNNNRPPLYLAVQNERIEVVKLLLDNGANINANAANGPSYNDRKWSILHIAARVGNKEIVEFLINKGANINAVDEMYNTPLYVAVENEKIEAVKLFVDNGANMNVKNPMKWSILHIAARKGNKEIVEFLINKGAYSNAVDRMGPLYEAVENRRIDVVKLFVTNGADINAKDTKNWSVLHIAAKVSNKEIVEFLINKGADTNAENNNGETPLYVAIENEKIEIVKLLVDNAANINANDIENGSILHIAVDKANKEIVEFLIDKGAYTNAENNNGETPLYIAVQNKKMEIVKLLVDNGANINAKDARNWSILHIAVQKSNKDIVEFLVNKGADTSAVEKDGYTPLNLAVEFEKIEVVKLLVDNSASINANDSNNWSILHIAAYKGNEEIVEFLINKEADTNAVDWSGKTPLYLAVQNEKIRIVKLLLDNGANINATDANKWSILHIAAHGGNKEIVDFLLNKGADINAVDIDGNTPLYTAAENLKFEVAKLLMDNGANVTTKSSKSILRKAACDGNTDIVEFLINKGADINAAYIDGMTPLFFAAANEKIEVVKLLVDNGANVNAKSAVNWSVLHTAANEGNTEIVEFLINKGADKNAENIDGITPLYEAVEYGKIEIAKLLVDIGANVNAKNIKSNCSILHNAASKGNKEIVEFLINKGADTNAVDISIEEYNDEIAKLLDKSGNA